LSRHGPIHPSILPRAQGVGRAQTGVIRHLPFHDKAEKPATVRIILPVTPPPTPTPGQHRPLPDVILLDLDGTLVDASDAIVAGVLELAGDAGLEVPTEAWARARIGHDPATTWKLLGATDPDEMLATYTERVLPRLAQHTRLLPGVADALASFREAGVTLAVATTRLTHSAHESLEVTGLDGWIAHVSGRDLVAHSKPAPDVLLHALQAVDGTPHRALMIGDSDADVLAAQAAGMPCFGVLGGIGDEKALRSAGAARILVGGLGDAPGALGLRTPQGPAHDNEHDQPSNR
jgi:phosphoglycolate phosphatase